MNKVSPIPERPSRASLRRLVEKLLAIKPADLPLEASADDLLKRDDMLVAVEKAFVAFAEEQEADICAHTSTNVDGASLEVFDCFDTLRSVLRKAADERIEDARSGLDRLPENDLPLHVRWARRA